MYKIAVIGAPDTVVGFKALGLEACPARGEEEARAALERLTRGTGSDEYAVIYIEESLAKPLAAEIGRFKDLPSPAIILIPGKDGSLGIGQSALQDAVERAVGTNIL